MGDGYLLMQQLKIKLLEKKKKDLRSWRDEELGRISIRLRESVGEAAQGEGERARRGEGLKGKLKMMLRRPQPLSL